MRIRRIGSIGATATALLLATAAGSAAAPTTWAARASISPHALNAVSCPSVSLCLAVGNGGLAVTSTTPSGGVAAWHRADVDAGHRLISASCPSASFCAATDNAARVLTTNDPTGGPSAWQAHAVDGRRWITGISCASPQLCVAVDRHGGILASRHPADAHRVWARLEVPHTSFVAVTCPSAQFCAAADGDRQVFVSTSPAGGSRAWHRRTVLPSETLLLDISCASAHACVLVNAENGTDVAFRPSTHPTAPGIWRPDGDVNGYPHEGNPHGQVACTTATFCAGFTRSDFSSGDVYVTGDLGRHWTPVPSANDSSVNQFLLSDIACAGTSLCVIVDQGGGAIVGF